MSNIKAKYGAVESLRTETTVYLKIIEVKYFVDPEEKRDVFCTIYGDATALVRTATVFQSERPLFLEEFEFDGTYMILLSTFTSFTFFMLLAPIFFFRRLCSSSR